ncbi:MAG: FKBP-type peptidyl-prolyl cis-trans isomerase [Bacteroidota bacterium]|nr:FKBP-type peptidyl-prolyl cis-trans isomerase [Bacteroidota bacterium]
MEISKNKVVSLTYTLKLDNAEGELVEKVDKTEPLVFIYGAGMMLPKFEEHLTGKVVGDGFEFTLDSPDAYGDYQLDMVVNLPLDIFKVDDKVDYEMLKVGNVLPMMDNQGNHLQGKVLGVETGTVRMDFNHPMSGKTLHFIGEIIDVREASAEELSHGHVHGDGGHQH